MSLGGGYDELYRSTIDGIINARLGDLRIDEATTGRLQTFFTAVAKEHGPGAAKSARTVMSGMFGLALRSDACRTNPVAGIERIRKGPSQASTALPPDAVADFIAEVRADAELQRLDIGDLLAFMVLTGCRIGEAVGLRWDRVDLASAKVTFDSTFVRLPGRGLLLQDHGKTVASTRTISVATQVVEIIGARPRDAAVVFPTLVGGLRDSSDTEGLWRRNRARLGYPDLKSHGLRKTCATLLDTAGLSARAIAEYLGHAKPSMTQDVLYEPQRRKRRRGCPERRNIRGSYGVTVG